MKQSTARPTRGIVSEIHFCHLNKMKMSAAEMRTRGRTNAHSPKLFSCTVTEAANKKMANAALLIMPAPQISIRSRNGRLCNFANSSTPDSAATLAPIGNKRISIGTSPNHLRRRNSRIFGPKPKRQIDLIFTPWRSMANAWPSSWSEIAIKEHRITIQKFIGFLGLLLIIPQSLSCGLVTIREIGTFVNA